VGNDVNLIHRLLKNNITEKMGFKAYTLYTGAAVQQLGIEDMGETMTHHVEAFEHLGEVEVWVQDMQPVWEQKRDFARITLPPEQIVLQVETDIDMPAELVWDYLSQPEFRKTLFGSDRQEVLNRNRGRIAPGSVYQCFHGDKLIPQIILEWQPFERIVTQDLVPIPVPNTFALIESRVVPAENGARLILTLSKARGPLLGRIFSDLAMGMMAKRRRKDIETFKKNIEDDPAARREEAGSTGQFATKSVREPGMSSPHSLKE
jgi:uncharacterized protein YndB with AHSA1/START domain